MEKTKYIPGPWHYKKNGFQISIGNESTRHDYLEHDYTVCFIEDNSLQAEANACLIAAAPDLLEACKAVLPFLRDLVKRPRSSASAQRVGSDAEDSLLVIEAAIAKAEEPPDIFKYGVGDAEKSQAPKYRG